MLHELIVQPEPRKRVAPVSLLKEPALVAMDDGRKQDRAGELRGEAVHGLES